MFSWGPLRQGTYILTSLIFKYNVVGHFIVWRVRIQTIFESTGCSTKAILHESRKIFDKNPFMLLGYSFESRGLLAMSTWYSGLSYDYWTNAQIETPIWQRKWDWLVWKFVSGDFKGFKIILVEPRAFSFSIKKESQKQSCQLSRIIWETPDFGAYLPVSRLEYEISQIIAEVCHFFSRINFPTINFYLFYIVWAILMLTSNISS